ncbi:isopeptide-forming domain-containing fimbrial protein, partial [Maribacter sp.]|uniref:isopeptide-forming domain-containing fimbrial protein n=1 Tax=Maribacter sp. TaxID=1897614 RepID=UPI0025C22C30
MTAQVSCGDISDYTTVCIGSPSTFSAATTGTAATTTNPGNDYGCLSSSPNPAWFYFKASSGGSLNIIQTNSNLVDVDGAIWGPFDSITDMTSQCGAFGAPLACDYASAPGFNFSITATTGKYYALLVTNYSGTATEISLTDGGSTASTDCRADIVTSKTVDNSTPEVGDTITWTLTAENKGISDASGLVITDQLPAGLTYTGHSGGTYNPATGEWTIGALAANSSVSLNISSTVSPAPSGTTLTNQITNVTVTGGEANSFPDDLSEQITITDITPPTLTINPVATDNIINAVEDNSPVTISGTTDA